MLSGTRFVVQLGAYWGVTTKSYKHYCDNKGLIASVKTGLGFDDYYPNYTLKADWDVLNEIMVSIRLLPKDSRPALTHIKGHQDNKIAYSELPLPAQLNVDADEQAGIFPMFHPGHLQRVIWLPHTGAQLHLPCGTLTNKYKRDITIARTSPDLKAKILKDTKWADGTYDLVDWDSHGKAYRAMSEHKTTICKLIHDLLPVGSRIHQYDVKYAHKCPTCKVDQEDATHLFRCQHPTRDKWRQKLYGSIRCQAKKSQTRPALTDILVEGLAAWIDQ